MSAPLFKAMTLDQFLTWEDGQALRHEFDGVQAVAMAGGTEAHMAIQVNLAIAVGGRLRGKACRFANSDFKIEVMGRIRYPDGFVYCSPFQPGRTMISDPVVVFEVLSDQTSGVDVITKNEEYANTPSIRRYVILAQDRRGGTMFERVGDDWVGHILAADSTLHMPEIDVALPLAELYEGVEFA